MSKIKLPENLYFRAFFKGLVSPDDIPCVWLSVYIGVQKIYLENAWQLPSAGHLSLIFGHERNDSPRARKKIELEKIYDYISKNNLSGFTVYFGNNKNERKDFRIIFGRSHLGNSSSYYLEVHFDELGHAPKSWRPLIETVFLARPGLFASQFNTAYRGWQNCFLPENYVRIAGEIPVGFRYRQPPADSIHPDTPHLDISLNPGRSVEEWSQDHFQKVDAEMWLGPDFWEGSPHSKAEVMAANCFLSVEDTSAFLYLKSWPTPFSRPDGEQGKIQQKLWRLLFGEGCEWPPGSGGIGEQ